MRLGMMLDHQHTDDHELHRRREAVHRHGVIKPGSSTVTAPRVVSYYWSPIKEKLRAAHQVQNPKSKMVQDTSRISLLSASGLVSTCSII
jgi:hypothetical protein